MNRTRMVGPWLRATAPKLCAWAGPMGCIAASFGRKLAPRAGMAAGLTRLRRNLAHGRFRRATRA